MEKEKEGTLFIALYSVNTQVFLVGKQLEIVIKQHLQPLSCVNVDVSFRKEMCAE